MPQNAGTIRRRKWRWPSRRPSPRARRRMRPGRSRSSIRRSRATFCRCCARRPSSARFRACGNVPFNVNVPQQTAGGTIKWVGELKPKPVTAMAFAMESLGFAKVAAIVVLSQELVRFSNPVGGRRRARQPGRRTSRRSSTRSSSIRPWRPWPASIRPRSRTAPRRPRRPTNPLADIMGLINHFATNNIPVDGADVHHVAGECAGAVVPDEPRRLAANSPASASTAAPTRACSSLRQQHRRRRT